MNLYMVSDSDYEWGCFVFETTRGRAKAWVAGHFGYPYIDMRSNLLVHGVNVPTPMLVDCDDDPGYAEVLRCGYHFSTEEEEE